MECTIDPQQFTALLVIAFGSTTLAVAEESSTSHEFAQVFTTAPDPAEVIKPSIEFEETRRAQSKFNQYFYFHRADTDFTTALTDVRECDLRARGLWQADLVYGLPKERAVDPSDTFLAGIAGPMVSGLVAAIAAPSEARRERRFGLRRCMSFKGYGRYGLTQALFEEFNFEATDSDLTEVERQAMLAQQALVASGEQPKTEPLGL